MSGFNKAYSKPLFAAMFPWMGSDFTGRLQRPGDAARELRIDSHDFWEMQMPMGQYLGHRVRDAMADPRAAAPDVGPGHADAAEILAAAAKGPRRSRGRPRKAAAAAAKTAAAAAPADPADEGDDPAHRAVADHLAVNALRGWALRGKAHPFVAAMSWYREFGNTTSPLLTRSGPLGEATVLPPLQGCFL